MDGCTADQGTSLPTCICVQQLYINSNAKAGPVPKVKHPLRKEESRAVSTSVGSEGSLRVLRRACCMTLGMPRGI